MDNYKFASITRVFNSKENKCRIMIVFDDDRIPYVFDTLEELREELAKLPEVQSAYPDEI